MLGLQENPIRTVVRSRFLGLGSWFHRVRQGWEATPAGLRASEDMRFLEDSGRRGRDLGSSIGDLFSHLSEELHSRQGWSVSP